MWIGVVGESRAVRGSRPRCSRVVVMLCRPRLVKKPSFPLEIRFPHVAMKFQTECSGLLPHKYGSLLPQSRAANRSAAREIASLVVCYSKQQEI